VDPEGVAAIKDALRREGIHFVSTGASRAQGGQIQGVIRNVMGGGADCDCVLVDELGILNGLYPAMSWAYVGGGLGRGIHSVIEPAIHGLPIATGPRGTEKFPEADQLVQQGQLAILRSPAALVEWLSERRGGADDVQPPEWRVRNESRRGGGAGIVAQVRSWLNRGHG
jgi:3-deoxy-D-manno-octulosonic-acid transferase